VAQGQFYDGKFFAVNSKKGVNRKTVGKVRCLVQVQLRLLAQVERKVISFKNVSLKKCQQLRQGSLTEGEETVRLTPLY
jgi:hypothetical protein